METKELLQLVENLKPNPVRNINDHILVVDGLNTFIRSFAVVQQINSAGNNVGGLTGCLKSIGSINRLFRPTRLIVAWDGRGGAQNRKNMDSHYKAQRAQAGVIHYDLYEDKEEEIQSMQDQIDRLVDYLTCLPITFIRVDKLEADDIIAYIAKEASAGNHKVTVVSTDRDFLQLIDRNVSVYSPVKKVLYDQKEFFDYMGVLPENYNIVKSLIGDKSDGLIGVKGVGVKSLVKEFPRLQTDSDYNLETLFEDCSNREKKKAVHNRILADWHHVETNFKIMDLNKTVLDDAEKVVVKDTLRKPVSPLQIGNFIHLLDTDKIDFMRDTESWLMEFSNLVVKNT